MQELGLDQQALYRSQWHKPGYCGPAGLEQKLLRSNSHSRVFNLVGGRGLPFPMGEALHIISTWTNDNEVLLRSIFCVKTYSVLLAGDFRAPHDQHRANLELKWQRHRDYRDGMWHYRAFLNIPYTPSSHLAGPKFPLEAELTPELMGVMAGSDAEVMQTQHRSEATRWHSVISRNKQLNMKVILKIFCFRNGFQFVFVFFKSEALYMLLVIFMAMVSIMQQIYRQFLELLCL